MDRSYIAANARSLSRLTALVDRLSDGDLKRTLDDGGTIAAALAHLAFWDYRVLVLLARWEIEEVTPSPIDPDVINDAIRPVCEALPPRAAAQLAVEAAQAVDHQLAILDDEQVARIVAAGTPIIFERSDHRDEHLAQIERRTDYAA
jgi:hypothetical protein